MENTAHSSQWDVRLQKISCDQLPSLNSPLFSSTFLSFVFFFGSDSCKSGEGQSASRCGFSCHCVRGARRCAESTSAQLFRPVRKAVFSFACPFFFNFAHEMVASHRLTATCWFVGEFFTRRCGAVISILAWRRMWPRVLLLL